MESEIECYLQSIRDFVGYVDLPAGRPCIISNDASRCNLADLEVSFRFIPLAHKSLHVKICHGRIIRTPSQNWDLRPRQCEQKTEENEHSMHCFKLISSLPLGHYI